MGLQTGLQDPSHGFPLHSEDAVLLGPTVAAERHEGRLYFYKPSGPIYTCPEEDTERVRLAAALFQGPEFDVSVTDLAEFLGLSRTTLWRIRKRYEREGVEGVCYKYRGRPPHKLTGERLERAQALLDEGRSNRQVAEAVEVTEGAIRYALRGGRLKRRPSPGAAEEPKSGGSTRRERSEVDQATRGGVAVRRRTERSLAAVGELEEARPCFERANSVARGGVLVALPALVAQGLFEVFGDTYDKLKSGFYGLNSVIATLAFMALLRIKTPNQLPSHSPGEFGRLLGLDRAPEQKTVRRKLAELGRRGRGLELIEAFARRWATEQPHLLGFLYIDGHVRPYHGRTHTLPKTWVARRRIAMPATTDYWVNDAFGEPLFFVTAPANDGLLAILEDEILPEIRSLVGPERRVTLVMDREAWSPDRFQRWAEEEGFDVLTYRKGSYDRWPEERFTKVEGSLWGNRVRYPLAEDTLELSNGFEVREVRCLDEETDHQTSVVTTRTDLPLLELAVRMFSRWRQENFFRYMRHEFGLDHLPTTAVEPADPKREVPNPARKEKQKEVRRLTDELDRLHRDLGEGALGASNGNGAAEAGELEAKISDLTERLARLKEERSALPERVPLGTLMDEDEIVRLEEERKRIHDVIKMLAYRAESELANLVGPFLGPHHQDEARSFLRQVFQLPADLRPDAEAGRLEVRLHGMANGRSNRALAGLCELLNDYDTTYPATSLRVVLQPPESQT